MCLAASLGGMAEDNARAELAVGHLRSEYLANPLGIDIPHPRLSWVLDSPRRDQVQTAYQVLVASSRAKLDENVGDLWDSGKVVSAETAQIAYTGSPLASRTACFWKVRAWDGDDVPSAWSEPARWTMGLLNPDDWSAGWIGQPEETIPRQKNAPSPWFRKVFSLDAAPVRATAYVASMGYHELYLNGQKVGDAVLQPAVSDYAHRAFYVTQDVTGRVRQGENCLGLWLGRGWYVEGFPGVVHRGPIARVQLEIALADGRTVTVKSDATWKTHASGITTLRAPRGFGAAYGGGERYDARLDVEGWNAPGFDDDGWPAAAIVRPAKARLVAQMVQPNRLVRSFRPAAVEQLGPGEYLFDMGRNLSGWFELRFRATPGETVRLEYTELRPPDPQRAGYLQFDECIAKDDGETVFRNRFNYHAFRWVKVSGLARAPKPDDATAWLIDTDFARVGDFACSNDLLTRIYQTVVWTYRCLSLGGYTVDCPHRERLGYGGDGQVTMETGLYTFDVGALDTKWLADWRDAQNPRTGELPNTAPYPHAAGGGPTWGAISILLPWQLYLHDGDRRVLETCYGMMQAYVGFLDSKSRDHLLQPYGHPHYGFIGDWVAPDRDQGIGPWSPEPLRVFFNNCFRLYCNQLMEKIATVLEKPDDAQRYRAKTAAIATAIQRRFFRPEENLYVNGEQPYLAFPLYLGLVPPSYRARTLAHLEMEIVETHQGHIDAGMHGTYFLLKYLNQIGRDDLIFLIANQRTYPGWGYMLDQGATTSWERWDGKHSRIHSTLLAIGSWFPAGVGGIQPDENAPGFRQVIVRPSIVGDLTWAKAHLDTIRGRVACDWRLGDDRRLELNVRIPANTTATVYVPATPGAEVTEGDHPAAEAEGVRPVCKVAGTAVFEIGSGQYHFHSMMPGGRH